MKEESTGKIVRVSFDPNNPPPLTAEQKQRLAKLREMKDEDIDTSDIPVNYNAKWVRVNPLLGVGNKQLVTLRIDPEVLDFFKSHGKRYQTRINAVLQEYVRTHQNS